MRFLKERTVVVGEISQRKMVMKEHKERSKHLNRAVFNEWRLYGFVQMPVYKCVRYEKELTLLDERNTPKACSCCGHLQAMLLYKRTYSCTTCGLVMDRDESAAVNLLHRYVARPGPHTEFRSVRRADVFTAIDNVKILQGF